MIETTTVLLVRHADVENPRLMFYGRLPRFPLSELGNCQAEFLADRLAAEPITIFYTSPMLRARQTAAILARRHPAVPIRRARPLIEVRTGWMGALPEQLPPRINLYEPPHSSDDETIGDVWNRVAQFLNVVGRRHVGETICCVSHGDPVVIAHAGARGLPLTLESIRGDFYPKKCSVTRLTIANGKSIAVAYQDVIGELAPELVAPH
ncbi:MAG: histidine phosphatase family protein [Chloroflexota bacterium]|nr:MAG: histidine phosphatase family protein [Chloroflexota bacterium]